MGRGYVGGDMALPLISSTQLWGGTEGICGSEGWQGTGYL